MSQRIPKKVYVGLSGGVDSSVSAALLKKAGYDVTGVFIRVWQPDFLGSPSTGLGQLQWNCNWKEDRLDAMRVCATLHIPFRELDLEKEYKKEVVNYMISEYKSGKTPNPDVMCNRYIKFGGFYDCARKNGADFVATGHYARVGTTRKIRNSKSEIRNKSKTQNSKLLTANYQLLTGLDSNKDQSYFLWQIRKEQLPHILFPVGGMKKPEVRKLAKKFGLITAEKKDSQGLCFIGKVDMKEFLSHYIKPKRGKLLDESGQIVGEHNGAFFYTQGERIGNLPSFLRRGQGGGSLEYSHYIIAKDMEKNTLTVSPKSSEGNLEGTVTEVLLRDCNWLALPVAGKTYEALTRYRQLPQKCRIAFSHGRTRIRFLEKGQTLACGQSLVVYDGEVCLGGGTIS